MKYAILTVIGFAVLMACIVAVATHLNKKIDALDDAIFQYMKEEHNARVEDYIPRDYYEKVIQTLTEKHTEEIAELMERKADETNNGRRKTEVD